MKDIRASNPNKAAIVLGVISFALLLVPGYFALILIAFAPDWAWLPVLPSLFFAIMGLVCGIRGKKLAGTVLNSIILFIIALFFILMFYRISAFVPQVF